MTNFIKLTSLGLASVAFAACTTTGNVEKNAAAGAVIGGVAGAVIGNNTGNSNAKEGALIGAGVGAAAGAYKGKRDDDAIGANSGFKASLDKSTRYYDDRTNRYYYYENGTSRTFYENGQLRSN